MLERSVLLNWSLQLFIEPLNAYCSFSIAEQHAFCVLEAFNDSWIIDCYCGWRLVKVICIVTFISHASHSLRIHRWNRFGVLASHPSLLWQQLSVCCPDLLFARGMVAICWRRQNPSVPVFQTARYVCVCARFFFFFLRSQECTCSCKLLPFPPWLDLRIGSGTCVSQKASGLKSGLAHFATCSWENRRHRAAHGRYVGGQGRWEEEFEKWCKLKWIRL